VVETVTADWDWSISTGTAGKAAWAFCQRNSELPEAPPILQRWLWLMNTQISPPGSARNRVT
jgi:hypothetical protein